MSIHSVDSSLLFFWKIFFNCLDQRFSVPYFSSFIQRYHQSAFHFSCHFFSLILFNPSFMSNFFFSLSSSEFFLSAICFSYSFLNFFWWHLCKNSMPVPYQLFLIFESWTTYLCGGSDEVAPGHVPC